MIKQQQPFCCTRSSRFWKGLVNSIKIFQMWKYQRHLFKIAVATWSTNKIIPVSIALIWILHWWSFVTLLLKYCKGSYEKYVPGYCVNNSPKNVLPLLHVETIRMYLVCISPKGFGILITGWFSQFLELNVSKIRKIQMINGMT